ncbi:MAG: D-aminoacyl-tRNA deacylase [Actinomycetota bacterium]|nr:D-aminoacyl-tRNA deacylase [Actinomycetota bacterium]
MKALIQRVSSASVRVENKTVSRIGKGLLVLLCVEKGDSEADAAMLAGKAARLRIFENAEGKMGLSVLDIHGEALVISQFTLAADMSKGNRPSFEKAEAPEKAKQLYKLFVKELSSAGVPVKEGVFGAHMDVALVNDGPVTIWLETGE